MKEPIIVVSSDERHLAELSGTLQSEGFHAVVSRSTEQLDALLNEQSSCVVILDLDALPVDNRLLREVKRKNPAIHLVVISARSFHPELKEAMASHIDVCLSKPTDREELLFWLKGIFRDEPSPANDPVQQ
jgi:DNA-binding response OmpR family regulator